MANSLSEDNSTNRIHFFNFIAEFVPDADLIQKGISRTQLISYLISNASRITICENTQQPYIASMHVATLDPTYNIHLPNVTVLPLLQSPFLFSSLPDSIIDNHRTATGALFELMFSPEELDETEEEGIYLFTSISISQVPGRLALKRARIGDGSDFQFNREL
jgi:hypothetical protein